MIECHDERDPHMPLWMSQSNWMSSSLNIHFIIMSLTPCRNKITSTRWYCFTIRSTLVLLSNGGWFSMNILIGCIQLYASSCSGSSITIKSCPIASLDDSACLIEGLDNFSIMTSDGVVALEEPILVRWSASWLSRRETYRTSNPLKNFSSLHTSARYSIILSLLQSYSFCTYFATNYESPQVRSRRMSRSLASRRPVTSLSYSTMLFIAGNSNWIAYLRKSPLGEGARH
jgi:hypothetical protein